jgi:hypothetical protein
MDAGKAIARSVLGFASGAILTPVVLMSLLRTDTLRGRTWALVVVALGSILGAVVGATAGDREVRGKAKPALIGCLWGTIIGTLTGFFLRPAIFGVGRGDPAGHLKQVLHGALWGAIIGAVVGRVRHGGRVTIGETMVVVAIAALVLALLPALVG